MLLIAFLFRIQLKKWNRDRNFNKSYNLYNKKLSNTAEAIFLNNGTDIEIN